MGGRAGITRWLFVLLPRVVVCVRYVGTRQRGVSEKLHTQNAATIKMDGKGVLFLLLEKVKLIGPKHLLYKQDRTVLELYDDSLPNYLVAHAMMRGLEGC